MHCATHMRHHAPGGRAVKRRSLAHNMFFEMQNRSLDPVRKEPAPVGMWRAVVPSGALRTTTHRPRQCAQGTHSTRGQHRNQSPGRARQPHPLPAGHHSPQRPRQDRGWILNWRPTQQTQDLHGRQCQRRPPVEPQINLRLVFEFQIPFFNLRFKFSESQTQFLNLRFA